MKRMAIALILLLTAVAAGQQPAPASLEGFVVQSVTNSPLPAAAVELRAPWGVLSAVESGADGKFSFANIPAGVYRVAATHSAYVRGEYGQSRPGNSGTILNLRPGQQMNNLKIVLTPGGVITGRVTRNGVPQAVIPIAAAKITYDSGQPVLTNILTALTDDLGEYHLFWLPPGQYYILADRDSNRPPLPPPSLLISPGGAINNPLISRGANALVEMQRTGRNPGFDRGNGPKTIPDTEMYIPIYSPGTTDRRTARVVDVAAGAVIDNINISLTTAPALHVRGTVSGIPTNGQGQPIRLVISLFSDDSPAGTSLMSVQADANGFFDLWRVRPGSYLVRAIANVAGNTFIGTAPIDVRDKDMSANITMEPGFTLSGKVSIERQPPLTADPALPNLIISAFIERADGYIPAVVKPAPDGSFTLQNVTAGDYRVSVRPIGMISPYLSVGVVGNLRQGRTTQQLEGAYVKSVKLGDEDVLDNGMRLTGPPNRPVMIVIGMDGGTIQGRVVNNRGESQSGATVVLIPESKLKLHINHEFIVADAAGKYEINSIAPGEYTIYAWDNVETGAWQNAEFLQKYAGTPVHIDPGGAKVSIEVTLSAEK
jgi:sarcosine oxidase gamma subunit